MHTKKRRGFCWQSRQRKLITAGGFCSIAIVAAACGGGSASASKVSGSSTSTTLPRGTITISDWRFLENGGIGQKLKNLYTSFEKTHPGVTVKTQAVSFSTYASQIQTEVGGGGGPDVMTLNSGTFATLQSAGKLLPTTSLTPSEITALRPSNAGGMINGKRYGLVSTTTLYGFLYNKALFSQAGISTPPQTFSSFLTDCKTIKAKTGKWGFAARNLVASAYGWYQDFTSTFIAGYGGNWSSPTSGKFTINSPQNIAAVSAFKQVYSSGCMDTGVPASAFRPTFESGNIGMLMDNSNAAATYTAGNKVLTNSVLGSSPPPFPTRDSGASNVYLAINSNSSVKPLAEEFMSWVYQPAQQKALAAILAPVSIGTGILPPSQFTTTHPWASAYYSQLARGVSVTDVHKHGKLTEQLGTLLMPYIAKVLSGSLSPSQALNQAQAAAVAAMG